MYYHVCTTRLRYRRSSWHHFDVKANRRHHQEDSVVCEAVRRSVQRPEARRHCVRWRWRDGQLCNAAQDSRCRQGGRAGQGALCSARIRFSTTLRAIVTEFIVCGALKPGPDVRVSDCVVLRWHFVRFASGFTNIYIYIMFFNIVIRKFVL